MVLMNIRQRMGDLDDGYAFSPGSVHHPIIIFRSGPTDGKRRHVIKKPRRINKEVHAVVRVEFALAADALRQMLEPVRLAREKGLGEVEIPTA